MQIVETFRNFPIKFYQTANGVEYESAFTQGLATDLKTALKKFDTKEFVDDLLYYYNDVVDIKYGTFSPPLRDIKSKGREYLGKLDIKLDVTEYEDEHSVKYLNKNRDAIPSHLRHIELLKSEKQRQERKSNLKNKISDIIKKVMMQEMFTPYKATNQLICKHCGRNIPVGTYYENYKDNDYHLECIWDKLVNKMPENSYYQAQKFFYGLEQFVGNWPPYGYDIEEDYLSDLELVKHNNRITHRKPLEESLTYISSKLDRM